MLLKTALACVCFAVVSASVTGFRLRGAAFGRSVSVSSSRSVRAFPFCLSRVLLRRVGVAAIMSKQPQHEPQEGFKSAVPVVPRTPSEDPVAQPVGLGGSQRDTHRRQPTVILEGLSSLPNPTSLIRARTVSHRLSTSCSYEAKRNHCCYATVANLE
eukprot:GHVU01112855.1.p1 GENE.GHVU01112855.1~~GHVU01112855.1.p1  ORF type:complete len:157 (-),score=0.13 GHVU01112855.1:252-722(-)